MKIVTTNINGLYIIEPKIFEDNRGCFFESYNESDFKKAGLSANFVQDNQSKSDYGVIRGLHYQIMPLSQTKLVRVLEGCVYDVAIDLRQNSPDYKKWFGIELSAQNKKQLYIPQGFAHGFSVLSEFAVFYYKCDNLYNPEAERGILYSDPGLNIDWKLPKDKTIISERDLYLPVFEKAEMNFF